MQNPSQNLIGKKIKKAREKAGLSRRKLMMSLQSHGLDVTEATILNWEIGKTVPRADSFFIVEEVLGGNLA